MPVFLAELPFPEEALIPIIIVVAQLWQWFKAKKTPPEPEYDETVYEPTPEEREIIREQQERGYGRNAEGGYVEPPFLFPTEEPSPSQQFNLPEMEKIELEPALASFGPMVVPDLPPRQEAVELTPVHKKVSAQRHRLNKFLATPAAARDAVLIAEVLGPPVSTRDEPID